MTPTIYASFRDPADAEKAAGALLDHGVRAENISLVASDPNRLEDGVLGREQLDYSVPTRVMGGEYGHRLDPLGNSYRQTPNAKIEGGNVVDSDLNPAQNDYPISGAGSTPDADAFSSRPPDARQDYNKGIETRDCNRDYSGDADVEMASDLEKDRARANRESREVGLDDRLGGHATIGDPSTPAATGAADGESAETEDRSGDPFTPPYDAENAAKKGLTTTTTADAAAGAVKGAGLGLGLGAAAALAALAIPGLGVVIGGGALAAALGGVAASTGAGAIAGGLLGYLKDQGLNEDHAAEYAEVYRDGGAILAVSIPEGDVPRERIEAIISKYGGGQVRSYGDDAYMA